MAIAMATGADAAMPQAAVGAGLRPGSSGGSEYGTRATASTTLPLTPGLPMTNFYTGPTAAPTELAPIKENVLDPWADMDEPPFKNGFGRYEPGSPGQGDCGSGHGLKHCNAGRKHGSRCGHDNELKYPRQDLLLFSWCWFWCFVCWCVWVVFGVLLFFCRTRLARCVATLVGEMSVLCCEPGCGCNKLDKHCARTQLLNALLVRCHVRAVVAVATILTHANQGGSTDQQQTDKDNPSFLLCCRWSRQQRERERYETSSCAADGLCFSRDFSSAAHVCCDVAFLRSRSPFLRSRSPC